MSKFAKALVALVAASTMALAPVAAQAATPGIGDKTNAVRYGASDPLGTLIAELAGEDDSQVTVEAPFSMNFFGEKYDYLCVSTNGGVFPTNVSDGECGEYDEDIASLADSAAAPMVAVLATDIDLSECDASREDINGDPTDDGFAVPCSMYIGETTVGDQDAFVITWYRVSMNDNGNDETLSGTFQLLLIKRETGSDADGWDFDFEFNYATLEDDEDGYEVDEDGNYNGEECAAYEEDGGAKADTYEFCRWGIGVGSFNDGVGGVGYEFFEQYPIGELIDSGDTAMIKHSLGSDVLGRYRCAMINGEATGCDFSAELAETGTEATDLGLAAAALIAAGGIAAAVRRRKA